MATSYTSLLGFALPVTGELDGTWGTVVNNSITQLVEDSVAGVATTSVAGGNWTLTTTGSGAANQARCAIIIPTGSPGVSRNIVAPSQSKAYIVINQSDAAVVFKGAATTGVTISAGAKSLVAWNGSDFVEIGQAGDVDGPASSTDTAVAIFDGTTGKLLKNSAVKIGTTGNTVIEGTDNTNAMLRITQLGTGNALVVEDSANPDASPLIVDSSGNIITGATSVYSVSGAWDSRITSNAATSNSRNAGLTAFAWSTDNTGSLFHAGTIGFGRSGSNTIGTQAVVGNTAALGAIRFAGSDGTNFIESAQISAFVDGTPGTNDMPGRLVFKTTADGASSPTERMRIANTGAVGIGATSLTGFSLRTSKTITGATSAYGIRFDGQIQSDVTTGAVTFSSNINTAAASFNVSFAYGYLSELGTIGANSTIGTLYGFHADSSLTGATNNYGFYSNIASGTGRWNFYANGTAENYLGGNLKIGATTARSTTAGTNHLSIFNGTAPAGTLTNGVTLYSASGDFNFMDSGGNGFKVGFRNIPAVGTKTAGYTLATGDVGKYVQLGASGAITIPDATFAEGDVITVFNNTATTATITCTITTAYIAGTDSDKATMTLASRGVATILFISSTVCVVQGNVT